MNFLKVRVICYQTQTKDSFARQYSHKSLKKYFLSRCAYDEAECRVTLIYFEITVVPIYPLLTEVLFY